MQVNMHVNMEVKTMSEKSIIKMEDHIGMLNFYNVRYLRRTKKAFFFIGKCLVTDALVRIRVERDSLDTYWIYEGESAYMYRYEATLPEKVTA